MWFKKTYIAKLAKNYSTPFFLFSQKQLELNYFMFCKAFKKYPKVKIDYSVKTNNELGILRILANLGSGAEVSSHHELKLALHAGFHPSCICFDGPWKSNDSLSFAIKNKIHCIYADSCQELIRINNIARKMNTHVDVGIRVSIGKPSLFSDPAERSIEKFGEPIDAIQSKLVKKLKECSHIRLTTLSTHLGSQLLSSKPYSNAVKKLVDLIALLKKDAIDVSEINLGGGFPSQSLTKMTVAQLIATQMKVNISKPIPSLNHFGDSIIDNLEKSQKKLSTQQLVLRVQPGRAISSSMGILVTTVVAKKRNWLILDASVASLPESLLFAKRNILLAQNRKTKKRQYNVAGCGLRATDNFGYNITLPESKIGDTIVIMDAGAYSISRSSRFTVLNPPVYLERTSKKISLIRRQETYEDLLAPMQ